jgi:pantothenate kinase
LAVTAVQLHAQDVEQLTSRARQVMAGRGAGRCLLGIAGAPGSGKSTVAERLAQTLGPEAVVVPMDGFHLTDAELVRMGLRDRKGAPATFDVTGYVALLRRLRDEHSTTVYAPGFDRSIETAVAAAIAVRPEHRLVVTEGNYLLHDGPGWSDVRPLLDEAWFVHSDETSRLRRLIERHVVHGKEAAAAETWATTTDQLNADLVAPTVTRADVLVTN